MTNPTRTVTATGLRRLGYVPQEPGVDNHFSAFEFVDDVAILQDVHLVLAGCDAPSDGEALAS